MIQATSNEKMGKNEEVLSGTKRMPRVILTCYLAIVMPRENLTLYLEVEEDFPDGTSLFVELVTETGQVKFSEHLDLSNLTDNGLTQRLSLPKELSEDSYELQVVSNHTILDRTNFDVINDKDYVQKQDCFVKGLRQQGDIANAIEVLKEKGEVAFLESGYNYSRLLESQERCAKLFLQADNAKLAVSSWETLAEDLFILKQFDWSKDALKKALDFVDRVEDTTERNEFEQRINKKLSICNDRIEGCVSKNPVNQETVKKSHSSQSKFPSTVEEFSSIIKRNRETLKLTIAFVARHLEGVREGDIRNWEKGAHLEKLSQYMKLSHQLGCEISELIQSKIKILRESQKRSTIWLARHTGIALDVIEEWEKGNDLDLLKKFLDLYFYYQDGIDKLPNNVIKFPVSVNEIEEDQEPKTPDEYPSPKNHVNPKRK